MVPRHPVDQDGGPLGQKQLVKRAAAQLTVPGELWICILQRPEGEQWYAIGKTEFMIEEAIGDAGDPNEETAAGTHRAAKPEPDWAGELSRVLVGLPPRDAPPPEVRMVFADGSPSEVLAGSAVSGRVPARERWSGSPARRVSKAKPPWPE